YAKKILKKFKLLECKHVCIPIAPATNLSKIDDAKKVDPTYFKSLVGSLTYLTCTRPDILYDVGFVSRYLENLSALHMKTTKRILCYLYGTLDFGISYSSSKNFNL
ncbi:hypothetical protein CFOL_v3_11908, partial [Cephalotus follicularis]